MTTPRKSEVSNQLLRNCWHLVKLHPRLLLFPLLSGAALFVIGLGCLATSVLLPDNLYYWVIYYILAAFIITFVNVAFYHEIFRAMASEQVSLRGGLQFARQRLRSIVQWTLFACSVGIIIRLISGRLNWAGRLAAVMAGIAWSVVAVFVIPGIIQDEKAGPLTLLRSSAQTLKKTWGESVIGYVKIKFYTLFGLVRIGLCLACLAAYGVYLALNYDTPASQTSIYLIITIMTLICLVCGSVSHIANSVYRCALYVYATEGVVPEPFTPELMDAAWKVKKT